MGSTNLNYTKSVVIVHGKSELALVKYIYTNLHLPVKIIAKDKGRSSIQINGVADYVSKKKIKSLSTFASEYAIEYDKKTKELKNFKLFIVMDTDDCEEDTRKKYISGELFKDSPLKDYIVPIYNTENLEDVMIKARIMVERIPDAQKGTYYSRVFPINTDPVSLNTINQVVEFYRKVENVKGTNLEKFAGYCYEQATGKTMK